MGFYTGDDKTGLDGFIDGDIDVLVGSSAIGTGVDGLQHVCNRLVINVLPWTNAEYEQLKGRVWRQGQRADKVTVVIPVTFAEVGGERWSWCESKLARLLYKKSIADAAVDGVVPEGHLRTPAQAHQDVMRWLERLDTGETSEVTRRPIVVPLSDTDPEDSTRRARRYGDFSTMNNRWNQTGSSNTHSRLTENSEEWEQYHTLYRAARKNWTIVPFEEVIKWLDKRDGLDVGDFGCGEAILAARVSDRHVVHSFDHVAINDEVVACDMARTPLDDGSLDVAVFSLSLMGSNCADYIREAHRTLALDGTLHVWEATSRFDDPQRFADQVRRLGFGVYQVEQRGKFTHIESRRLDITPDQDLILRFRAPAPPQK
ncbi:MAG: methyltransferase-like protein, partial [Proteobacteria bacterium]|nr:methyltransferase-like protein [Pseudomonadota bacterium]